MSVEFLDGGEILRGCLLVIQNDVGLRNPPEGVDAEIRARWRSTSDDGLSHVIEIEGGGYQKLNNRSRNSYWRCRVLRRVTFFIFSGNGALARSGDVYDFMTHLAMKIDI